MLSLENCEDGWVLRIVQAVREDVAYRLAEGSIPHEALEGYKEA